MLQLSLASLNGYDTVVDHSPRSFFLAKGGKLFTCKSITPPSNLGMVPVCGAVKDQEQDGGTMSKKNKKRSHKVQARGREGGREEGMRMGVESE